ncbi:PAS-domain containing protein [Marinibactrum halimedae]|uniref:histidine kinase n=1 Tax=Marinibactrum halimedae TaxID=1444977 RepID=A0AA37T7S5_9GAMM|nr:PAS-domain containing protein [Marinibactrum halimedae]MCD9460158.1 PAS-domain containing protein [Marinibactrum halimedae]GLS26372.1 hybrid sensor histidine kinase/response regulator [Marinibactrum halimedae]
MSISILVVVMLMYLGVLFYVARLGDRDQFLPNSWTRHPLIYAFAVGVYCTSWTFYGLVGTASRDGLAFLPILLGPALLFIFGQGLLKRITALCKQENTRSIADFLAARYGKRRGVATTVTLIMLAATTPYIALQIKAVTDTLQLLLFYTPDTASISGYMLNDTVKNIETGVLSWDSGLVIAIIMVGFSLLFGIRRLEMSGYHAGLMSVVAFESVVKLIALVLLAIFASILLWDTASTGPIVTSSMATSPMVTSSVSGTIPSGTVAPIEGAATIGTDFSALALPQSMLRFVSETALAAMAFLCLPRMFHITFVENLSPAHTKAALRIFPVYLVVFSVCIIILAQAGNTLLSGYGLAGDTYVLALPLVFDRPILAIIAFVGGFSAATAMIIVATVTLSHMLSNDVILPLLIVRRRRKVAKNPDKSGRPTDFSRALIASRRLTVVLVVGAAYAYQHQLADNTALTEIGLTAFALIVQLAPALLFGLLSDKGNANGVYAGLITGCGFWMFTLLTPLFASHTHTMGSVMAEGLFGLSWLKPDSLFYLSYGDSFTRSVSLSLAANVLAYWVFSIIGKTHLSDDIQARAFRYQSREGLVLPGRALLKIKDLRVLLNQFLGESATEQLFLRHVGSKNKKHGAVLNKKSEANPVLMDAAEHALAGVVGVASSRTLLSALASGEQLRVADVVNMFEETARALRFNQDMIMAAFESIGSGISVVNQDFNVVTWNRRYEQMFDYPAGYLKVGTPVADVVRFNAERGKLGPGTIEEHVQRRLTLMRSGTSYRVVRHHEEKVIEIKGQPLPGGGYVTTYDDITEFIDAQKKLKQTNLYLEQRVQERTAELEDARKQAEQANRSKSRFVALASHDILQPLNAASLYTNVLLEQAQLNNSENQEMIKYLNGAISASETIISTLLETAKLDTGEITPDVQFVPLEPLFSGLVNEFQLQANEGVRIRWVKTRVVVKSDPRYLRRIVQNLLSNAVKYTRSGKILIGCRRKGSRVAICVLDTGSGIHPDEQAQIFEDFYRSRHHKDIQGIGLGLAVANRFSQLLDHSIHLTSEPGRGSQFQVCAERAYQQDYIEAAEPVCQPIQEGLKGKRVFYVDDDNQNLQALATLLNSWGVDCQTYNNEDEACAYAQSNPPPDMLLMDWQLNEHSDGIQLGKKLLNIWKQKPSQGSKIVVKNDGIPIPVCLVSASPDPNLPCLANAHGFDFLRKPIKPGKLRAILEHRVH